MATFLSLRELDDTTVIEADICVVGAGAAGITIAKQLAGSRQQVLVVESGGLEIDADTNTLAEGETVGMTYVPLETARVRVFGGTTAHWTGWCTPLRPIDFRTRPWIPLSGWPITYDELRPFYDRAQSLCELGPFVYDRSLWASIGQPLDPLDPERFDFAFWEKGPPTRFGERYRPDLKQAANVRVLLFANLVDIATDPSARTVTGLQVKATDGRTATVRARRYVLACGTIENARVLLAANKVAPQGLGNAHGWVGRCFMEHPSWRVGELFTDDPFHLVDTYYRHFIGGRRHGIATVLTDAAQERLAVQDCCAGIVLDFTRDIGLPAHRRLWKSILNGEVPTHIADGVWSMLQNLGDTAQAAWRRGVLGKDTTQRPHRIRLGVSLDPRPNPDSRVTLSPERDRLGMPRARLDWRVTPEDARSLATLARVFAGELTRLGLARVRLYPGLDDPAGGWALAGNLVGYGSAAEAPEMSIAWHHMGTTRMAADPAYGVVDRDCRVHGIDNLYVAGGSVFPTGGVANPTLSIVAVAARLADHLREAG